MTCVRLSDGIVCVSPVRTVTDRNGRTWTYEDTGWFGPIVLTKTGEVAKRQPGPNSAFWDAFYGEVAK